MKKIIVQEGIIVAPEMGRAKMDRPAPLCGGTGKCKIPDSRKKCPFSVCD